MATIDKNIRRQVESDFIYGYVDFPQLAERYNIKANTIRNWAARGGWHSRRAIAARELEGLKLEKFKAKSIAIFDMVLDVTLHNVKLVAVITKAIYDDWQASEKERAESGQTEYDIKKQLRNLAMIGDILSRCAGNVRSASPTVDKDSMDQIRDELNKIMDERDKSRRSMMQAISSG